MRGRPGRGLAAESMVPAVVAAMLACAGTASAQTADDASGDGGFGGVLTFLVENDIFAGVDRQYTNGSYLRYTPGPDELPALGRFIRRQAEGIVPAKEWHMTYGIGQSMFTPDDITIPDPPLDDRPYAGFLFGTVAISANTGQSIQTLALDLGFVGPPSLAEQTQELIHQIIGDDPKGWGTQLGTELAFRFLYEGAARYGTELPPSLGGFEVDVVPAFAVGLGTLDVSATGALMVRLGEGLDIDYGPPRVRRSIATINSFGDRPDTSWYVFASAEGRVVGRNLFLDGNTFRDSRSVDSNLLVGDFQLGATIDFGRAALSYTHVFRTREFSTKSTAITEFGSLAFQIKF